MKFQARYLLVYLLLGMTALFINTHENNAVPVSKPLSEIPVEVNDWQMVGQSRFSANVLEGLKPTDYLYRIYKDNLDNRATIYLGYHDGGPQSGPIHSPKHCLPGSGWFELSEKQRKINVEGREVPIVEAVYQMGDQKEMFLYFFQVKGKVLTDEYSLKVAEIMNSMFHKRRDSAFIRVSVPFQGDATKAAEIGDRFMASIYPHIDAALPL